MIKIRLKRLGKKNESHYRIVVSEARSKRDGDAIEYLGHYNPRQKELNIDLERVKYWLSKGAQPTDTIRNILVKNKLLKPIKRKFGLDKKKKKEQTEEQTSVVKPEKKETKPEEKPQTETSPEKKEEVKEKVEEVKEEKKEEIKETVKKEEKTDK